MYWLICLEASWPSWRCKLFNCHLERCGFPSVLSIATFGFCGGRKIQPRCGIPTCCIVFLHLWGKFAIITTASKSESNLAIKSTLCAWQCQCLAHCGNLELVEAKICPSAACTTTTEFGLLPWLQHHLADQHQHASPATTMAATEWSTPPMRLVRPSLWLHSCTVVDRVFWECVRVTHWLSVDFAGNHLIDVAYDGAPIPGSPFTSRAFDTSAISVSPVSSGVTGRPVEFQSE